MTSSRQTTFDVFGVAADGSIDEHRMTWPSAALTEKLKVIVSENSDTNWIASQFRNLALRLESGQPKSTQSRNSQQ